MHTNIKLTVQAMSHQSGALTAFPQKLKLLQIAEVNAVQSPATLRERFVRTVGITNMFNDNSFDLPCDSHVVSSRAS